MYFHIHMLKWNILVTRFVKLNSSFPGYPDTNQAVRLSYWQCHWEHPLEVSKTFVISEWSLCLNMHHQSKYYRGNVITLFLFPQYNEPNVVWCQTSHSGICVALHFSWFIIIWIEHMHIATHSRRSNSSNLLLVEIATHFHHSETQSNFIEHFPGLDLDSSSVL